MIEASNADEYAKKRVHKFPLSNLTGLALLSLLYKNVSSTTKYLLLYIYCVRIIFRKPKSIFPNGTISYSSVVILIASSIVVNSSLTLRKASSRKVFISNF